MNNPQDILIRIPITEYDIELFRDLVNTGESFTWQFLSENSDDTVHCTFYYDTGEDDDE